MSLKCLWNSSLEIISRHFNLVRSTGRGLGLEMQMWKVSAYGGFTTSVREGSRPGEHIENGVQDRPLKSTSTYPMHWGQGLLPTAGNSEGGNCQHSAVCALTIQSEMHCQLSYSVSLMLYFTEQSKHNSSLFMLSWSVTVSHTQEPRQGSRTGGPRGNEHWVTGCVLSFWAWVRKQEEGTPLILHQNPSSNITINGK